MDGFRNGWMAQKKSHEVDGWLARPPGDVGIVLIYGPDRGLVSERAERFAKSTGLPLDDPFTVVKLDAGTLEKDPGRLLDEAHAVAMFASRRLLWIRGAGADKRLADDVKALIERPAVDTVVLIEAGDLKKGTALRTAAENGRTAMVLPCYPDEGREIERVIDEELGKAGLGIELEARQALRESLGGDRKATRGELEKLTLYMHGQKQVTLADVRAAVSDVAENSVDDVVDSAFSGDLEGADMALTRALAVPSAGFQVVSAMMRQCQSLHLARGAVEGGASASSALAALRPPVLFSRRQAVERSLSLWKLDRLERVLGRLQALVLNTRRRPELAVPAIRQAILGIAAEASAARRNRA
jgi:DNA polymerase-3 subunit delta